MTPIQFMRAEEGYTEHDAQREQRADDRLWEAAELFDAADLEAVHAQDEQRLPFYAAAFEWAMMNPRTTRYTLYAIAIVSFVVAWLNH